MVGNTALSSVANHTEVCSVLAVKQSYFREDSIRGLYGLPVSLPGHPQKTFRQRGPGPIPTVTEKPCCHWWPTASSWVTSSIFFCSYHRTDSVCPGTNVSHKILMRENLTAIHHQRPLLTPFIEGKLSPEAWRSLCHHAEAPSELAWF